MTITAEELKARIAHCEREMKGIKDRMLDAPTTYQLTERDLELYKLALSALTPPADIEEAERDIRAAIATICSLSLNPVASHEDWNSLEGKLKAIRQDGELLRKLVPALLSELARLRQDAARYRQAGWIQEMHTGSVLFSAGELDPREVHDNGKPCYPVYRRTE